MKKQNLTGQKFGRLTAMTQGKNLGSSTAWDCVCECGGSKTVRSNMLVYGKTKSCGCIVKTHGHSSGGKRSPAYMVWDSMRSRCQNPNHKAFGRYGGRGIFVSERWQKFENFLADMGEPPKGMSLDRINNNDGYSKENCRWTDWKTQNRNRAGVRNITALGATRSIAEWSELLGWPYTVISSRLKRGWPEDVSVTLPKGSKFGISKKDDECKAIR